MSCLRISASPDGESHFDEVNIPTAKRSIFPDAAPFELSAHYPVAYPLHPHPSRRAPS